MHLPQLFQRLHLPHIFRNVCILIVFLFEFLQSNFDILLGFPHQMLQLTRLYFYRLRFSRLQSHNFGHLFQCNTHTHLNHAFLAFTF